MGTLTIELNDVRIFASYGWHEEEGKIENEFKVNIIVALKAPKKEVHSLEQTIDYVAVYQMVQQAFAPKKGLLETCAMQIAHQIKEAYPLVQHLKIHIQKMNPPISNFSGSVSVSYTKSYK